MYIIYISLYICLYIHSLGKQKMKSMKEGRKRNVWRMQWWNLFRNLSAKGGLRLRRRWRLCHRQWRMVGVRSFRPNVHLLWLQTQRFHHRSLVKYHRLHLCPLYLRLPRRLCCLLRLQAWRPRRGTLSNLLQQFQVTCRCSTKTPSCILSEKSGKKNMYDILSQNRIDNHVG